MKPFKWLIPLFLFILIAPATPWLDLKISSLFYTPSVFGKGSFYDNFFFHFLYKYGEIIGFVSGAVAAVLFLVAFAVKKIRHWQKGALALILTFVLGAGVITNSFFKEYWGRPRPKQITEFGGKYDYRPFWRPNFKTQEPQKSFPSGHVAMGFYFFSLLLVSKRYQSRLLMGIACCFILFLGGGLMISRIAQGGHFLSDTLASLIIMWWTALFFDFLLFERMLPRNCIDKRPLP